MFSALAFAQYEVSWYFQHAGVASSKSKAGRVVPVDIVRQPFSTYTGAPHLNFYKFSCSTLYIYIYKIYFLFLVFSCYSNLLNLCLTFAAMVMLQDPSDPTIGFLLDGMDHLCCLVRKYIAGLI